MIDGILSKPADLNRSMPFTILFPARYKEDIEINLPEEWSSERFSDKVTCANFLMKADVSYSYRQVLLKYEYESFKDNVSPAETPRFLDSYNGADKSMDYSLTWGKSELAEIHKSVHKAGQYNFEFIIGLLALIGLGAAIWWTQRRS